MDSDGADKGELVDAIGDVPVARPRRGRRGPHGGAGVGHLVGRGDVVVLGRRVGEPVIVRVGGVPVARGDRVEVDGEVGVHIVERLVGDGGSP